MRSMLKRANITTVFNLPAMAVAAGILAIWECAVWLPETRFEFLPAPTEIAAALVGTAMSGQLFLDALHTVTCALAGWLAASALGGAIGLVLAFSTTAYRFSGASLELLRPLPAVAFIPVAVLLFGFTVYTEIVVITYASIWPVYVNTLAGVRAIHPRLFEAAATLNLTWAQRIGRVVIPAVLPFVVVGARTALGLALVVAVISEMVGNPAGLGWGLVSAQESLRPDLMFGYLVVTGVLGVLLTACLQVIVARLFPGMREIQAP